MSIIDDYSQLIVASKAFVAESTRNFIEVFRYGLSHRGIPARLYVDNGGAFTSAEVKEICMRLGIRHVAGTRYEAEGRGKIERWHRSLRNAWIRHLTAAECKSLTTLNESLVAYLNRYHARKLRSTGMSPMERWRSGSWVMRPLEGDHRHLFGKRRRRRVDRTGCVAVDTYLYEVSQALRG
jgi:hypothetical protein